MSTIKTNFLARLRAPMAYAMALAIVVSCLPLDAFSQGRPGQRQQRQINRPAVNQAIARQQIAKRAYVAGAVAERRRENSYGYRNDRRNDYRRHDYRNDSNDNTLAAGLVGAAIGALAVGVIMNSKSDDK